MSERILDFHIHLFPDKVAPRAMETLKACVYRGGEEKPEIAQLVKDLQKGQKEITFTDGTVKDTLEKLRAWHVERAVVLNISTNPKQQENVNRFAIELNQTHGEIFTAFGSVHPDAENALEMLEQLSDSGIKGVKFHPDYQGFLIEDPKLFPLYQKCADLGLITVFHTGFDVYSPHLIHASPKGIATVNNRFPYLKMVLAHMGGILCWDEVENTLLTRDIFLDTSYCAGLLSPEQGLRMIRRHGADRIVFGSDCPWQSSANTLKWLEKMELEPKEKRQILWDNGAALLGQRGETV